MNTYFPTVLFILYACLTASPVLSQTADSSRTNPILFADLQVGGAMDEAGGFSSSVSLNYEFRKNLFTLRYLGNVKLSSGFTGQIVVLPVIKVLSDTEEWAALYGIRSAKKGHSLSVSAGISYLLFTKHHYQENQGKIQEEKSLIGIPYEVNIKWFKSEKKRFRIVYGLIPIGKPTALGRSIGFKFYGSIAKASFTGLGLTYGLGYHKHYQ